MCRPLTIILNYTAVKAFPRTSLMSRPRTSHNPRYHHGHPRNPLICKGRVTGHLLCHSTAKHLEVRLFPKIHKQAHIGLPKSLSLSNMKLRHKSPTEYLLSRTLPILPRYLHLYLPSQCNTQLRLRRHHILLMGLCISLIMNIERRVLHPRTQQSHKCLLAHHIRLHMMNTVSIRLQADSVAHQAIVIRSDQPK